MKELQALTALRFLAALWVVAYHARLGDIPVISRGSWGVSMFFVLSGFVLAYNYREGFSKGAFAKARVARILPVYLLSLAVAYITLGGAPIRAVVESVLLVQAFDPTQVHLLNLPAWSLSAEAFFYLLFPFMLRKFQNEKRPLLMAGLIWLAVVIPVATVTAPDPTMARFIIYSPLLRLPEFLMGIAAGVVFLRRPVHVSPWPPALLIVAATALPMLPVMNMALAPLFTWLILGLATRSAPKPLLVLGGASYALYLLHVPLFFQPVGVWLVVTLSTSLLVFRYFEEPMRQRLRQVHSPSRVCRAVRVLIEALINCHPGRRCRTR